MSEPELSSLSRAYVTALLRARAGVVLEEEMSFLIDTRLTPLVTRLGLESMEALVSRIRDQGDEAMARAALEALLNNETSFFRDAACFKALREHVLPSLIAARERTRTLRLWSAACSTGQEPYSLALLLAEHFPKLADWDVQLIATDLSQAHLTRARQGRFTQFEVNRGLPIQLLVKYFDQHGTDWVVHPAIRDRIRFSPFNLVQRWPEQVPFDLILLRNVMIYFDVETRRTTLGQVHHALAPDGVLVLGAAENTYQLDVTFDRLAAQTPCCFRPTALAGTRSVG